jgi:Mg2+/Co2+ transporter CorC
LEDLEKLLVDQAAKNEVDKAAPELIRSIFELSDKRCRDVMVPRTDVVSVDLHASTEKILTILSDKNHSRMPVLGDDEETILGVLHARDLLPLIRAPRGIVLQDIIRPAVYVPWFKPIGDLLRDLQKQRNHMAIVVDEYGSFIGIVTLEDILREIVGDIGDEFEEDEKSIEKLHDGSFLVDATLSPEEFAKHFDVELPSGDFETLGGYLSWAAGALPETGDKFTLAHLLLVVHSKEALSPMGLRRTFKGPATICTRGESERVAARMKPESTMAHVSGLAMAAARRLVSMAVANRAVMMAASAPQIQSMLPRSQGLQALPQASCWAYAVSRCAVSGDVWRKATKAIKEAAKTLLSTIPKRTEAAVFSRLILQSQRRFPGLGKSCSNSRARESEMPYKPVSAAPKRPRRRMKQKLREMKNQPDMLSPF